VNLTAGTTYFVQVGTWNNAAGGIMKVTINQD
jgi:hypothetical protein